ncbi:MAG: TRAP transporter large permease [Fusobacterium mortiferum]|nr:TRAP transporter large permease [uncultured Fusobacterium sp.]MCI6382443.1 TRAP transporter large permease [Fusobacterium mortiferum]MDY4801665.1 TRAP transporter large permease [Fusobacterium mortiferum]
MILEASIVLTIIFVTLFVVGIPIAISIALSSLATILLITSGDVAVFTAAQKMAASLDSFSLIAVPFFILSGTIMNRGGLAIRLVNLAKLIGGRIPGALAHTNIIGNMLFGAISGSAIAASTAVGGTLIPLEEKDGYDKSYSAAVNIASAPTGMLIPPSSAFIIYSLVSGGTSIAALFIGGYISGIMWGLAVMFVAWIFAKKNKYPVCVKPNKEEVIQILIEGIPSVVLILVVIIGIVTGIFTAIEASAVCVVYCIILSMVFYKTVTVKDMYGIMVETFHMTGVIMFLIAASSIMSFAMAFTGLPAAISEGILSVSENKYVIITIINILLFIIGTFMDIGPAILIFTPIFLPIALKIGMHPVHFGVIFVYNLCIGTITPPVGTGLFVGAGIAKLKVEEVLKTLVPYYAAIIGVLFIITFFPQIIIAFI